MEICKILGEDPLRELLFQYAIGGLDPQRRDLVATHLDMCFDCANKVREYQAEKELVMDAIELHLAGNDITMGAMV